MRSKLVTWLETLICKPGPSSLKHNISLTKGLVREINIQSNLLMWSFLLRDHLSSAATFSMSLEHGFPPDSHFVSFYPQNLITDPQKVRARDLSNEYMINPKLYLFIYGFIFGCISGLKGKNYQYFGSSF